MPTSTDGDPHDAEPYEPTDEEVAQMVASSPSERAAAQEMVLRECSGRWQKVARLVGELSDEFSRRYPHLPSLIYRQPCRGWKMTGKSN